MEVSFQCILYEPFCFHEPSFSLSLVRHCCIFSVGTKAQEGEIICSVT